MVTSWKLAPFSWQRTDLASRSDQHGGIEVQRVIRIFSVGPGEGRSTAVAGKHSPGSPGGTKMGPSEAVLLQGLASLPAEEGHEGRKILGTHLRSSGHFPLEKEPALG